MIKRNLTKEQKSLSILALSVIFILGTITLIAFTSQNDNHVLFRNGDQNEQVVGQRGQTHKNSYSQTSIQPHVTATATELQSVSTSSKTIEQLKYLIEEEKLAHDVYVTLGSKYNTPVFTNISNSETKHQNSVLALLTTRGVNDPRSGQVGVFNNNTLQALYNELVEQGSTSLTEAYKVGVAIEELDISDIDKQLSSIETSETDIITTLKNLKRGSQNHLRAFSAKL